MNATLDQEHNPQISVIIPAHNPGRFLLEAINSIQSQVTTASFEIIVVDDRSDDVETFETFQQLKKRGPPIYVIANNRSPGPGGTRNVGADCARGEWLAFLDADDVWPANSLEARWKIAATYPKAKFIAGRYFFWHPPDSFEEPCVFGLEDSVPRILKDAVTFVEQPSNYFRCNLRRFHLFSPGSVFVRASLFQNVGGFGEHVTYGEDQLLWMKLSVRSSFIFVNSSVLWLRRGHSSLMSSPRWRTEEQYQYLFHAMRDPRLAVYKKAIRRDLVARSGIVIAEMKRNKRFSAAIWLYLKRFWWMPEKYLNPGSILRHMISKP